MAKIHNLVVSDVHMGSGHYWAMEFLNLVKRNDFERLIIVGDLYEVHGVISDQDWKIIEYLRSIKEKIIYVHGNHDPQNGLLGKKSHDDYAWQVNGKWFYACHGDRFDRFAFLFKQSPIDSMIATFHFLAHKMDPRKNHLVNWIDYYDCQLAKNLARKAKRHAIKHGFDGIFCGHVHQAQITSFFCKKHGKPITYINCGHWTRGKCSYATIDSDGQIQLVYL